MITVRLSGGLGNQFFQYAVALLLNSNDELIRIEYQGKTIETHTERELAITKFNIPDSYTIIPVGQYNKEHLFKYLLVKVCKKIMTTVTRSDDDIENPLDNRLFNFYSKLGYCIQENHRYYIPKRINTMHISGMWHSTRYTEPIINKLRNYYTLKKEFISNDLQRLIEFARNNPTVAIHVRRGDYTTAVGFSTCSLHYYFEGMNVLRSRIHHPIFLVFSDDIKWCKNHFSGEDLIFMDAPRTDYEDFELMRNCRHFIISNSTYSWWAAYLSEYEMKVVITPKTWFDSSAKSWLNLPEWIQIDR